jgi:uncharacterized membrane protein YtjA (UPF0391 family)
MLFASARLTRCTQLKDPHPMLNYAIIFLIIAILAGVLGFGVVAGTAAMVAKVCFVVFLVLFLFSLLGGGRRTRL